MAKIVDSLPSLPSTLKLVQPYLLRADELQTKDPVMAYWCLYFAAQLGLDLKTHEPGAREYLLALITRLEDMKKDIGPNDAIDNESAGAAYVENFALRVFSMADNEDRKEKATRSTAKKFLAAANFLELLKVFEKSNNAVVNEEKVRYARWKATDIAKAFREGRKPAPGSAHEEADEAQEPASDSQPASTAPASATSPPTANDTGEPSGPRTPPRKLRLAPGGLSVPPPDMSSPGSWSTVATPGSVSADAVAPSPGQNIFASAMNRRTGNSAGLDDSPLRSNGPKVIINGTSSTNDSSTVVDASSTNDVPLRKAVHFSASVVGGLSSTDGSPPASPEISSRLFTSVSSVGRSQPQAVPSRSSRSADPTSVHLPDSSPSNSSRTSLEGSSPPSSGMRRGGSPPSGRHGGLSTGNNASDRTRPGSSPPSAGGARLGSSPPHATRHAAHQAAPSAPPAVPTSQTASKRDRRSSNASRHSPPELPQSRAAVPPPPPLPTTTSSFTSNTSTAVSFMHSPPTSGKSPDKLPYQGLPPTQQVYPAYNYTPQDGVTPTQAPQRTSPVELTPSVIAKAQKHARFAISALEYEDAETARKQLREALKALGEP